MRVSSRSQPGKVARSARRNASCAWLSPEKARHCWGLRKVYFFVHDYEELYSPELCAYAVEVFNRGFGAGLKPPQLIGEEPGAKELTLF